MQACRAYYSEGRFIPLEPLDIPEGSQAIVTVIDFLTSTSRTADAPEDTNRRQREAVADFRNAVRNSGKLPPEFDEIMSQRVNIERELDL